MYARSQYAHGAGEPRRAARPAESDQRMKERNA
jgi:hypothetical protein